jgi:hypothetical protein
MTDSSSSMLGHVALRLRLVYEPAADPGSKAADGTATRMGNGASSGTQSSAFGTNDSSSSDIPGWRLVGLLPEEAAQGWSAAAEDAPDGALAQGAGHSAGQRAGDGARDSTGPTVTRRRFATEPIVLTLDRDEAEGYYLNLTSPQPSLFALLRLPDVASATAAQAPSGVPEAEAITASYSEAARWMDGGMVVVRTALPEPMLAWIAEFAQYHFQAEGKKKRGKFRPSFLSRQEFGEVARSALDEAGQGSAMPTEQRRH